MDRYNNLEHNIMQVERMLEEIFDSFTYDDFKCLQMVPFIYKDTIRFVPVEIKKQVQALLLLLDKMKRSKAKMIVKTR